MGGATHICSDKTGTLTMNKMTVMSCMTLQKVHQAATAFDKVSQRVREDTNDVEVGHTNAWTLLTEGVLFNSSARVQPNDGSDKTITDKFVTKGNVTEQGLLKFFVGELGGQQVIDKKNSLVKDRILSVIQFTSKRKRAAIAVRYPENEGTDQEVRVFCKGAPDMLFEYTTKVLTSDGSVAEMGDTVEVPDALKVKGETTGSLDTHKGIFERTVKNFAA